jgi:hypothetical protein
MRNKLDWLMERRIRLGCRGEFQIKNYNLEGKWILLLALIIYLILDSLNSLIRYYNCLKMIKDSILMSWWLVLLKRFWKRNNTHKTIKSFIKTKKYIVQINIHLKKKNYLVMIVKSMNFMMMIFLNLNLWVTQWRNLAYLKKMKISWYFNQEIKLCLMLNLMGLLFQVWKTLLIF